MQTMRLEPYESHLSRGMYALESPQISAVNLVRRQIFCLTSTMN